MSAETSITIGNDWRTFPGQKLDLVLTVSNPRSVTTPSTTAPTTTSTTTTTTEPDTDGGTNLYVLPGICVNIALSFPPIRGCKERNEGQCLIPFLFLCTNKCDKKSQCLVCGRVHERKKS